MCTFRSTTVFLFIALICRTPALHAQHLRIADAGPVPNSTTSPPTLIKSVLVPYTDDARRRGIQGTITIEGEIDKDGTIKDTKILKGLGFGLDEAATKSVREWTFSPARRDDAPVSVIAQIDVEFNLRNANAVPIGAGMNPPKPLSRVEAQYTEAARLAKVRDCTVVLQGVVKTDGSVDVVSVVEGFAFGMTESAIHALEQWKFAPGQKDGQDVDMALGFVFNFHLH